MFVHIMLILQLKYVFIMGKKEINLKNRTTKRSNMHMFALNDQENKVLTRFLTKYKIQNKSKFIRETLMSTIIRKLESDSPTLFD